MSSESTAIGRLQWLDVVRGIAAIIVYLQHTLERDIAAYEDWSWHWVNLGRVGVTAFFLVSGFVIPFSLERSNSLKAFWISRFFRLYPLYWATLIAALACGIAGHVLYEPGFDLRSPIHIGVNATMIQQLVRIPNALPVFWTLGLELLFYWLISAAFLLRSSRKSLTILYGIGGLVLFGGVAIPLLANRQIPGIGAMFLVVTACFGTVFYRFTESEVTASELLRAGAFVAIIQVGLAMVAYRASSGAPGDPNELIGPSSRIGSAVVGYLLFFGAFAIRQVKAPRILAHLGLVSYSVYLVHPFVWYFSPKLQHPVLTMVLGFVVTVALATVTYRLFEAPSQALGKRILRSMREKSENGSAALPR